MTFTNLSSFIDGIIDQTADEGHPAVIEYVRQIPKLIALTALTMIVALVGNLFLAFIITTSSRRRLNPVQILIIHTCVADIMFALCTILPQIATFLTFPVFYGGDFLCRCVKYLQVVPMYASPYLLIAISIDRYLAICKPLKAYRWKYRLCQWLAFGAWVSALGFSAPQIVTFKYGTFTNSTILMCISDIEETWLEQLTITFFVTFAWILPSIVVAVLYTLVCVQVWRSNKHCATPDVTSTATASSTPTTRFFPNLGAQQSSASAKTTTMRFFPNHSAAQQQTSSASTKNGAAANGSTEKVTFSLRKVHNTPLSFYKIKTVKLTMTIVACNFVLMAPFCLINLLMAYFPTWEGIGKRQWIFFFPISRTKAVCLCKFFTLSFRADLMTITCIMLVGNLNSCVNPWIYLIYNYKQVWKAVSKGMCESLLARNESQSFVLQCSSPRPTTNNCIVTPTLYSSTNQRWPSTSVQRKPSQTSQLSEVSI